MMSPFLGLLSNLGNPLYWEISEHIKVFCAVTNYKYSLDWWQINHESLMSSCHLFHAFFVGGSFVSRIKIFYQYVHLNHVSSLIRLSHSSGTYSLFPFVSELRGEQPQMMKKQYLWVAEVTLWMILMINYVFLQFGNLITCINTQLYY